MRYHPHREFSLDIDSPLMRNVPEEAYHRPDVAATALFLVGGRVVAVMHSLPGPTPAYHWALYRWTGVNVTNPSQHIPRYTCETYPYDEQGAHLP